MRIVYNTSSIRNPSLIPKLDVTEASLSMSGSTSEHKKINLIFDKIQNHSEMEPVINL